MINVNKVLPGKKILMVGTGNVGLIVSYQLLQAGAEVCMLIDAAHQLGGYGVHAAKIRRAGVPIQLGSTIVEAHGNQEVEAATIASMDEKFQLLPGTEKTLEVDTICLAVGLTPLTELAWISGCKFTYLPGLGGHVPIHNRDMETTVKGFYAAGDVTGVEEASTALEEGRLAGVAAAQALGYLSEKEAASRKQEIWQRLNQLRTGPFGSKRKEFKEALIKEWTGYDQ